MALMRLDALRLPWQIKTVIISEVYVELKGEEMYMKKESTTNTDSDGNVYNSERDVRAYETIHFEKKIAAENIRLEENDSEKWLTSFDFPAQVTPTYHGKNAHFKWLVRAGLDMKGIDPKSDWQELTVDKELIF